MTVSGGRRLRPARRRLLEQRQGRRVRRIPLENGPHVPDRLIAKPRTDQHDGQVDPQRHIVRPGLDRLAQAIEQGLVSLPLVSHLIGGRTAAR
jgi:hypothetical protein